MTHRTLKRLGLCIALALLCAALTGLPALAEDNPSIEGLSVRMGRASVDCRDEADIYFDEAYVPGDDNLAIDYALTLLDITGGREFPVDIRPDSRCFTVPVAGYLEPGHAYRAFVTASADGCEDQTAHADFVVTSDRSDFRVEVDINGERDCLELRTCEEVDVNIHAPEALEVQFGTGHAFEEDVTEEGRADLSIHYFWDYETTAAVYARARFADPDDPDQDIWVVSNPVTIRVAVDEGSAPLPAPVIEEAVSVPRGGFAEFTVDTDGLPGDLDDLRLFMMVCPADKDETLKNLELWPDEDGKVRASIVTADLAPGEYTLNAAWRAVGRVGLFPEDAPTFTVTDNGSDDPIFAAVKTEVVPHESCELYAYVPGASGLCVYEGWEIRETFEGRDSFTWSDGSGDLCQRDYYVGVWNADTGRWERRNDLRVTITIDTEARLPDPVLEVSNTDLERGVLYAGDGLSFTLHMTEVSGVDDPDRIWYDVRLEDTTDWFDLVNDEGFRLFPDDDPEDGEDPSCRDFNFGPESFQVGHSYALRVSMGCWGYPMQNAECAFVVAPRTDDTIVLTIGQLNEDGTFPNVLHDLSVNTNGATALQLYWDYGWQNVEPDVRDESGTWDWAWTLDEPGRQVIMARATWDEINWDEDVDWDNLNWSVYSAPRVVNVQAGEAVAIPEVSLSSQGLTRGDTLTVRIGPAPEHVRAYALNVFGPNDEGEYHDHFYGDYIDSEDEAIDSGAVFHVPTVLLPAGDYRVRVTAIGDVGYSNSETDYYMPDLYFHLADLEADRALVSTGEYDEESGLWRVPVHEAYTLSGFVRGASALCLYEDGDQIDEWWGADSLTWTSVSGFEESHEYTLGVWDEDAESWQPLDEPMARVVITAGEGELTPVALNCPPAVTLGENLNFSFSDADNAGWYNVTVRDAEDEWKVVYDMDYDAGGELYNLSMSTEGLEPNREYVLRVHTFREGWSGATAEGRFLALPEAASVGLTLRSLRYTEDGPVEDDDFYVNQDVEFTLNAPDCTLFQVFWDHEWQTVDWAETPDEGDDSAVYTHRFTMGTGNPGAQTIVVRVSHDEEYVDRDYGEIDWDAVSWGAYTEPRIIDFNMRDAFTLPMIELGRDEVNRGELLPVHLGHLVDPLASDHVYGYELRVYDAEGDERWDERLYADFRPEAGDVTLSTAGLRQGTYRVQFSLSLESGYYCEPSSEWDRTLWFTVNEAEDAAPTLTVHADGEGQLYTGDQALTVPTLRFFTLSGIVPGASRVCLFQDGEIVSEDGGDNLLFSDYKPRAGACTYTLGYWNDRAEEWEPLEDVTATVNVTAEGEALAAPTIDADLEAVMGENYDFTVTAPEGATALAVDIHRADDGGDHPLSEIHAFEDNLTQGFTLYSTEDLLPGSAYVIRAEAWSEGRNASDAAEFQFIPVAGEVNDSPVTVSVPASVNVNTNCAFQLNVTNRNEQGHLIRPTRVEVLWDGDWNDVGTDGFDQSGQLALTGWRFNHSGEKVVMARATWDEDLEAAQDWNRDINWIYSPAVAVTVNPGGSFNLPAISLNGLNDGHIDRNGAITVELSGITPAIRNQTERVGLDIYRLRDGRQFYHADKSLQTGSAATQFYIKLGEPYNEWEPLGPGRYRVHLHFEGKPGCESVWTDGGDESLWFTIDSVFNGQALTGHDDENDEDIWSEPSNALEVTTLQTFRIHAELPGDEDWCVFRGEDIEEEWYGGGDRDLIRDLIQPGDSTYCLGTRDEDGEWRRLDDFAVTVHVTASDELAVPGITDAPAVLAASLNEGKTYSFTFKAVDNAAFYHPEVRDEDGWRALYDEEFRVDEELPRSVVYSAENNTYTVTFTAPFEVTEYNEETGQGEVVETNHLLPGHAYVFRVAAFREGWAAGEAERRVLCAEEANEDVLLTINGKTEPILVGEEVDVHIEIPNRNADEEHPDGVGPTVVQMFWGNDWRDLNGDSLGEDFDYVFSNLSFTWEAPDGDNTVMARATWDAIDFEGTDWTEFDWNTDVNWVYSAPVRLNTLSYGRVALPDYELRLDEDGKVARGQSLELWLGEKPEHVRNYHLHIRLADDWDAERLFLEYDVDNDVVRIPTATLMEYVDYVVELVARGENGWRDNDTHEGMRFRVVSGDTVFTTDRDTVRTHEEFNVDAYVPGAEQLRFFPEGSEDYHPFDGDSLHCNYSMDRAGDLTLVLQRGQDDDWETVGELTVHVEAPDGDLAAPAFDGLPGSIPMSDIEDSGFLPIDVTIDDSAEHLSVDIWRVGENGGENETLYHEDDPRDGDGLSTSFIVPADALEAGRTYGINVYTWTEGYNYASSEREFFIAPAGDAERSMALEINGSTENQVIGSNVDYTIHFRVEAPEGEETTNQQLYWDGGWLNMWPDEDFEGNPMDGAFDRCDAETQRTVMMRCSFDGGESWIYSNAVLLTVLADGTQPDALVSLDNLTDGAIVQGEDLRITIAFPEARQALDENGEPILDENDDPIWYTEDSREHLQALMVTAFAPGDNDDYDDVAFRMDLPAEATEAVVPTLSLEPGRYYLEVWGDTVPYWNSNGTQRDNESLYFEVLESEISRPTLKLSSDRAAVHERVTVTAFNPNGGLFALYRDGDRVAETDARTLTHDEDWDRSGEHTFQLAVWSDNLDDWRMLNRDDARATVTITSEGTLPAPEVEGLGGSATRGEALNLTLKPVRDGQWYDLNLHAADEWEDTLFEWHADASELEGDAFAISIPGGILDRPAGTRLELSAFAHADRLDTDQTDIRFVLLDSDDTGAVTLSADRTEVNVNEEITFTFAADLADEPSFAQIYLDGDWRDLWSDDITGSYRSGSFTWSLGSAGGQSAILRVTSALFSGYVDDWNDLTWSYSSPVSLTVTEEGSLPEITAGLSAEAVRRGENLTVSIGMDRANVDRLDVTVYGPEDDYNREWLRWNFPADTTEAVISTADLDEGEYRIEVHAFGQPGWRDAETDRDDGSLFFRVKKALDTKVTFTATKTQVLTWEDYTLSAIVPGAARLALLENGEIRTECDGDHLTSDPIRMDRAGKYRYTLEAYSEDNDPMVLQYEPVTVTVVSQGELAAPVVEFNATPAANEDFTFTVQPVDNAEEYDIRVTPLDDYENDLCRLTKKEDGSFTGTVDADQLEAGVTYRINVWVAAAGWTTSGREYRFTPVAEGSVKLTLTLDGAGTPEDGVYTIASQQPITVKVTAESDFTDVELDLGDHAEPLDWFEENQYWSREFSCDSGRYTWYARANTDNGPVFSDSVTLVVNGEAIDTPAASLNTNRQRILADDTLEVALDADWEKVDVYGVVIRGATPDTLETNYSDYREFHEGDDPIAFNLAELLDGSLADGETQPLKLNTPYRVCVNAWAKQGYDNRSSDPNDDSLYFTVIESLGDVSFSLTREPETLLLKDESLTLSIQRVKHITGYNVVVKHGADVVVNETLPGGAFTTTLDAGLYTVTVTPEIEWGYTCVSDPVERLVKQLDCDLPDGSAVLTLPTALTRIDDSAFQGNEALRMVDLTKTNISKIGASAFANCRNLVFVKLPAGIDIDPSAFSGSPNVVFICEDPTAYEGLSDILILDQLP